MGETSLMNFEPIPTDEQISAKIAFLKEKRNRGTKLCDKEIIELARLIRTLASRKYRQRQNAEKKTGVKKPVTPPTTETFEKTPKNDEVERMKEEISRLEAHLVEVLEREKQYMERDRQALARERQANRREAQQLRIINNLKRKAFKIDKIKANRASKVALKAEVTMQRAEEASAVRLSATDCN